MREKENQPTREFDNIELITLCLGPPLPPVGFAALRKHISLLLELGISVTCMAMATHSSTSALQKEPNASFLVENHGTSGLEDALLPLGSVSSVLLAVYLLSHTKVHSTKVAHSRDNTSNSAKFWRGCWPIH